MNSRDRNEALERLRRLGRQNAVERILTIDTPMPEVGSLFLGLEEKGLLDETAVFVTGEFGRTPKINTERIGRDHYPRAMFMLMAGGGARGGQVLGQSSQNGSEPVGRGYTPDEVAASFYSTLGIDHTREYQTSSGRPIMIIRDGAPSPTCSAEGLPKSKTA